MNFIGKGFLKGNAMTSDVKTPPVGEKAPGFDLPGTGGTQYSLDSYLGEQHIVLYFYPKDDTPGCTKEACAFRDLSQRFEEAGAVILGVSGGDVASKEAFAEKYELSFPLLADEDFDVSTRYGAYKLRERDGKQFMGIERTTFLIDKDGVLRKVYPQVDPEGHADKVLNDIAQLS
jgi:thioredoxin-dependent peroxiredoxin